VAPKKPKTDQSIQSPSDQYWATLPSDDLPNWLVRKVDAYYEYCSKYGFMDRWRRAYMAYYGMSETGTDTTRLNQAGTNGELYVLKVNHFRSLLQNLLVLICQQPPAIQPKASNTDSQSMNQTILAKSVIDYYMREQNAEKFLNEAAEFSLFGAEGFVTLTWDATAGQEAGINPDTGKPFYDGDAKFKSFHPIDVIRECATDSNESSKWYIVREFENKYDLAAKFPEFASDLISIQKSPDFMNKYNYVSYDMADCDDIPTYTFYHEPTDAVPNGRLFKYVTNDLWLTDTSLPYKHLPVYGMRPAKWFGTRFGYTVAYDMMGIQKNIDALNSVVATNQMNYGIQNIVVERGSEVNVVGLAQGLNAIEVNPGSKPPTPLNLVQTPGEIFSQIQNLVKEMETLSGINSTARGNPEESLKSGTALALVAAQAIQFNSGLQKSYNNLIQDVCTGLIEILQLFANTPRIAAIAGKSNRSRVKEFKGEDLANISRVVCESVNPISKTAAGRLQMAQDLLQIPNMIQTPQHYFEVVETGTLEPMLEHQTSQMIYIRSENEELADGNKVQALVTDQHLIHIHEHSTVLDSIEARQNPAIIKNTTDHIQDHINQLKTADPALLQALGQQPIPKPQPPQPSPQAGPPHPPGPGGPPGQPLPPGAHPSMPGPQPGAPGPQPGPPHPAAPSPIPIGPKMAPHVAAKHFPKHTGLPANTSNASPVGIAATEHLGHPELPNLPKGAPPELQQSYDQLKGNLTS
jgi:hypothetical protein